MNVITNTLFIGKVLNYFESALSTNALAAEWLQHQQQKHTPTYSTQRAMHSEGSVFLTFDQTAGRGQYGNRWESEAGQNIAFSVILNPSFLQAKEQFHLNKVISLAVRDTIQSFCNNISIKWANDIYIGDKKICGILIQNSLSGYHIQHSIVGIGLNINQQQFNNLPNATSLCIETGKTHELFNIVSLLCQFIEQRYLQLKSRQFDKIDDEYMHHLYRFDEDAFFQRLNNRHENQEGDFFKGKIKGVNDTGKLLVETIKGIEIFDIKEIKFII